MNQIFSIFTLLADWLTFSVFKLAEGSKVAHSVHFFIEDLSKIFVLLIVLIYLIALLRASLNIERARDFLKGKNRFTGYLLAALLGAVTPFCSCSSIPIFIGFISAGIPIGATMAFLITSPVINEVAILIMGNELGLTFMLTYLLTGLFIGVVAGWFFDLIKADRFVVPLGNSAQTTSAQRKELSFKDRNNFAIEEVKEIVGRVYLWVIVGIGAGAIFHGWVPAEWVERHLGGENTFWTVPLASLVAIPLYSDATAIIPIAQSMLEKGLPLGTTLTFMLSVVGASLPGFILLKQVMKKELLISFFLLLLVLFSMVGWLFNGLEPYLL